jgi:hypothetical protein
VFIWQQLSSQTGDRTEQSNLEVVRLCLENPGLLEDITAGLSHQDADLVGDCAEVLTKVAEQRPDLVAPYVEGLAALLSHKKTRARWEAVHALSLVAALRPDAIKANFERLTNLLHHDNSVIVRDYATDTFGAYAQTSAEAARAAYPVLVDMLTLWDGKHAARALRGLGSVAKAAPDLEGEIMGIAQQYTRHGRGVVQKAAKALVKVLS